MLQSTKSYPIPLKSSLKVPMNINEKIRLFREDHSLSQEEVASRLSMSTKGYAKIERGETRVNFPRLEQILDIFNIDIYELLNYGCENKEIDKIVLMLNHKDEIIKFKDELIAQKDLLIESLKNELNLLKDKIKL